MTAAKQPWGEIPAHEIRLDSGELKRRLGGDAEATLAKYESRLSPYFSTARVKYSVGERPTSVTDDEVSIGDVKIKSKALARQLLGFSSCAVVALTLGVDTDRFIKRCEACGQTLGFVADAVCSALADGACYTVCNGYFGERAHTSPFAPGYADTDISALPDLLKIADEKGSLGISFTDAHLMIPTKSIVVIVGKM